MENVSDLWKTSRMSGGGGSGNGGQPSLTPALHYTSTQRAITAAADTGTNRWKLTTKRIT